jgi:hypothetical protein
MKMTNSNTRLEIPKTPPTTVQEFRENVRKYLCCIDGSLTVRTKGGYPKISVDNLSSLSDIYKLTKTGFYGDGESPEVTPLVGFSVEKLSSFMDETNQVVSCSGFFSDKQNYRLYRSIRDEGFSPQWVTLDNQIYREFFGKVFGDFSGYIYDTPEKEVA